MNKLQEAKSELLDEITKIWKFPDYYWVVTLSILLSGGFLSEFLGDWAWFARSGSLLVVTAIVLSAYNIPLVTKVITDKFGEKLRESHNFDMICDSVKFDPELFGITENADDNLIRKIAEKEHLRRIKSTRSILEMKLISYMRRHELFIAAIGTFIWGFGDLLNYVPHLNSC